MPERDFNREYLGIPGGNQTSPFGRDLFDRATQIRVPSVPPRRAFGSAPQQQAVAIALKGRTAMDVAC